MQEKTVSLSAGEVASNVFCCSLTDPVKSLSRSPSIMADIKAPGSAIVLTGNGGILKISCKKKFQRNDIFIKSKMKNGSTFNVLQESAYRPIIYPILVNFTYH